MRRKVVDFLYGDLIKNSFFFTLMDHTVVTRVCQELKGTAALQYDCIFQEGEIGNHMYFVVEGEVETTCQAKHLLTTGGPTTQLARQASSGAKQRATHKLKVQATCLRRRGDKSVLASEFTDNGEEISETFIALLESLEHSMFVHKREGSDSMKSVDFFDAHGTFEQAHDGQWTLRPTFDSGSMLESTASAGSNISNTSERSAGGSWELKHSRSGLTGVLRDTMPLGESMWTWDSQGDIAGVPEQEIPLSIVVFVGRHKRHSYFGECCRVSL